MDYHRIVKLGQLHPNSILPPYLHPRKPPPLVVELALSLAHGDSTQKRRQDESRQNNNGHTCQNDHGPTVFFERQQPPEIAALLDQLKIKSPFWNLSNLRKVNNLGFNDALATALGLTTSDCLKSCITGQCKSSNCFERNDRNHNTGFGDLKIVVLKTLLTTLLAKGT